MIKEADDKLLNRVTASLVAEQLEIAYDEAVALVRARKLDYTPEIIFRHWNGGTGTFTPDLFFIQAAQKGLHRPDRVAGGMPIWLFTSELRSFIKETSRSSTFKRNSSELFNLTVFFHGLQNKCRIPYTNSGQLSERYRHSSLGPVGEVNVVSASWTPDQAEYWFLDTRIARILTAHKNAGNKVVWQKDRPPASHFIGRKGVWPFPLAFERLKVHGIELDTILNRPGDELNEIREFFRRNFRPIPRDEYATQFNTPS